MISDQPRTVPLPAHVDSTHLSGVHALRVMGNDGLLEQTGISICGSRDATERGLELADTIGYLCARHGIALVAGNARGVDDIAQTAALRNGGNVIAVLPEGLRNWRPRSSQRDFLDHDLANIAVVSQFEDHHRWRVYRAMARNRLVIALSRVLFVVDAGTEGGTFDAGVQALRAKHPLAIVADGREALTPGSRQLIVKGGSFITSDQLESFIAEASNSPVLAAGQQARLPL